MICVPLQKKTLLVGLINRDHRRYATTIYQRQSYKRKEGAVAAVSVGSVIISRPLGAVGVERVKGRNSVRKVER